MRVVQVPFGMHPFGGLHKISGTVENPDGFVQRRIHCFGELGKNPGNKKLVSLIWLDTVQTDSVTGAFEFPYLGAEHTFTLLSFDHTGTYDPVIKAGLIPEPM